MSTQVGEIHFDLDLDHRKFSQGVKSVDGDTQKLDGSLGRSKGHAAALGAAMAVAGAAVVAFGVSCVKAFQESESMIAQTNAVIKSTGGVAGVTAKDVTSLASSLQKSTAFSDEQVRSAQNMALTFTGIGKDIFPEVTATALDMATALNHGITPSGEEAADTMKLLGKALQDPDAGLGALKRVGVNVDELSAKFNDSMTIQEKQKLILKELGTEFGGSAASAAKTFQGRIQQLRNKFNDFQETIGKFIVKGLLALYDFVNKRILPVFRFLGEHMDIVLPILIGLAVAVSAVVIPSLILWTVATINAAIAQVALYAPIIAIGLAITAVVAALVYAYTHWEGFRKVVDTVIRAVTTVIKWAWENIIRPIWTAIVWYITNILIPGFQLYWQIIQTVFNAIAAVVKWVWDTILKPIWDLIFWYVTAILIPGFQQMWTIVGPIFGWIGDKVKAMWETAQPYIQKLKDIWEEVRAAMETAWNWIRDNIGPIISGIMDTIKGVTDSVKNFVNALKGSGKETARNLPSDGNPNYNPQTGSSGHAVATGGFIKSRTVNLVGEEGPELFMPQSSGQIIDAQRTAQLMSEAMGSGGGNVYLNIEASGIMATSRSHQRQVISTLIEAANEELIGRGLAPIADNKLRAAV